MARFGIERKVGEDEWTSWTSSNSEANFQALLRRAKDKSVLGAVEQLFMAPPYGVNAVAVTVNDGETQTSYRLFEHEDGIAEKLEG